MNQPWAQSGTMAGARPGEYRDKLASALFTPLALYAEIGEGSGPQTVFADRKPAPVTPAVGAIVQLLHGAIDMRDGGLRVPLESKYYLAVESRGCGFRHVLVVWTFFRGVFQRLRKFGFERFDLAFETGSFFAQVKLHNSLIHASRHLLLPRGPGTADHSGFDSRSTSSPIRWRKSASATPAKYRLLSLLA
jgi:hypothetical protein